MKKLVAILFLSLLMLQAIPVLHFFVAKKSIFYSLIDEEKPVEKTAVEKKAVDEKEFLTSSVMALPVKTVSRRFASYSLSPYSSPSLDALTPPPNA